MYARKLLEIAHMVGLSQSAISREFGITRTQVSLWAHNKRRVPTRYCKALATLVADAIDRMLLLPPTALGAMAVDKGRLLTLLNAWEAENLEAEGIGPSAAVQSTLNALERYKDMTPAEMGQPANVQRLLALCATLHTSATLLSLIRPFQDILEKDTPDVISNAG